MNLREEKMSGRKLTKWILALLILSVAAFAAVMLGFENARVLVYIAVPIGAFLVFLGGVGAALGRIEKDF